ncbi:MULTISPECIES: hypothetical protein [unclassified Caballeronia]|uniref:hypothetical protein n=1 Tax=unclassified Caballeronia TaxID=2646786 RepID=UPI001F4554CB|nr:MULTISPECIES: hypothetical protein [unclassified Caballeronia]MCE4541395.1 hypothetical protein [Caballeronia sp. PC1]MCE4569561.1 hypothetical protein [Caballeronia sp. CLC5]
MRVFIRNLALSASCFLLATTANASGSILTYKGTKFGVSEGEFIKQHPNQGFVCSDSRIYSGRECRSALATYANAKADTVAVFFDDKLALMVISLDIPSSDITQGAIIDTIVPNQLAEQYGQPNKTQWPVTVEGGTLWTKRWDMQSGDTVAYVHSHHVINGQIFDFRNVSLSSKAANNLIKKTPSDM